VAALEARAEGTLSLIFYESIYFLELVFKREGLKVYMKLGGSPIVPTFLFQFY